MRGSYSFSMNPQLSARACGATARALNSPAARMRPSLRRPNIMPLQKTRERRNDGGILRATYATIKRAAQKSFKGGHCHTRGGCGFPEAKNAGRRHFGGAWGGKKYRPAPMCAL